MKQQVIPASKKQEVLDEISRAMAKMDVEIAKAAEQLETLREKHKKRLLQYRQVQLIDEAALEEFHKKFVRE